MKIAIVHDYLNQYGGAERVVEALHELFPDAPIYTSVYLPEKMPESFRNMEIRESFLRILPFLDRFFKFYFLLYPFAFISFDLSGYEVILSSSSAYAKGIKAPRGTMHICYCYTPTRFIWRFKQYMQEERMSIFFKKIIQICVSFLKRWDFNTASNVDFFIAISENVRRRIRDAYKREAEVIYPPVNTEIFYQDKARYEKEGEYFLIVSRLAAYKRVDLAIEAFNKLGLPLKIVGDGPYRNLLEQRAHRNIEFLGKIDDMMLNEVYARCIAVIFPGEEDFGIVPVEAQAAGKPVIAYARGGALETVVDGVTGVLFDEQSVDSLIQALNSFYKISFNSIIISQNALRFSKGIFKKRIFSCVLDNYEKFKLKTVRESCK